MANNNNVDYKKWLIDFGKAAGKSTFAAVKTVMPNTTGNIDYVKDKVTDAVTFASSKRGDAEAAVSKVLSAGGGKSPTSIFKETLMDVGKGFFGVEDELDLESFLSDEYEDEDFSISDDTKVAAKATLNSTKQTVGALAEMTDRIQRTTAMTAEANMKGVSKVIITSMSAVNDSIIGTNKRLDKMISNSDAVINYINTSQIPTNNLVVKHLGRLEQIMTKQAEMFERANRNSIAKPGAKESLLLDGFSMEKFGELMKSKNTGSLASILPMLGMMMTSLDMGKSFGASIGKMIGSGARDMAFSKMLGSSKTGKKLSGMDKRMNSLMMNFLGNLGESNSGFLSDLLGVSADTVKKGTFSKYNKGAVPWDGTSKKALEEVIPYYLSQIASSLSGREKEIYDYKRGTFTTASKIKERLQADVSDNKRRAMSGVIYKVDEFGRMNDDGEQKLSEKEINKIKKEIDKISNEAIYGKGGKYKTIKESYEELEKFLNRIPELDADDKRDILNEFTASITRGRISAKKLMDSLSTDIDNSTVRAVFSRQMDNKGMLGLNEMGAFASILEETAGSKLDNAKRDKELESKEKAAVKHQKALDKRIAYLQKEKPEKNINSDIEVAYRRWAIKTGGKKEEFMKKLASSNIGSRVDNAFYMGLEGIEENLNRAANLDYDLDDIFNIIKKDKTSKIVEDNKNAREARRKYETDKKRREDIALQEKIRKEEEEQAKAEAVMTVNTEISEGFGPGDTSSKGPTDSQVLAEQEKLAKETADAAIPTKDKRNKGFSRLKNLIDKKSIATIATGGLVGSLIGAPLLGAGIAGAAILSNEMKSKMDKFLYGSEYEGKDGKTRKSTGFYGRFGNMVQTSLIDKFTVTAENVRREVTDYAKHEWERKMDATFGKFDKDSNKMRQGFNKFGKGLMKAMINPVGFISDVVTQGIGTVGNAAIGAAGSAATAAAKLGFNVLTSPLDMYTNIKDFGHKNMMLDGIKNKGLRIGNDVGFMKQQAGTFMSNIKSGDYKKGANKGIFTDSRAYKEFSNNTAENITDETQRNRFNRKTGKKVGNMAEANQARQSKANNKYQNLIHKYARKDKYGERELSDSEAKSRYKELKAAAKAAGKLDEFNLIDPTNKDDIQQFTLNSKDFVKKKNAQNLEDTKEKTKMNIFQKILSGLSILVKTTSGGRVDFSDIVTGMGTTPEATNVLQTYPTEDEQQKDEIETQLKLDAARAKIKNEQAETDKARSLGNVTDGSDNVADRSATAVPTTGFNADEEEDDKNNSDWLSTASAWFLGAGGVKGVLTMLGTGLSKIATGLGGAFAIMGPFIASNIAKSLNDREDRQGVDNTELDNAVLGTVKQGIKTASKTLDKTTDWVGKIFKITDDATSTAITTAGKNADKLAKNATEEITEATLEGVAEASAKAASDIVNSNNANLITKTLDKIKKLFDDIMNSKTVKNITKVLKFGYNLITNFKDTFFKILNTIKNAPKNIMKKIPAMISEASAKSATKVAGTVLTFGMLDVAFGVYDAVTGTIEANKLFGVAKGEDTETMRVISAILNVILGIGPFMPWFDMVQEIIYMIGGTYLKRDMALAVFKLFSTEEEEEELNIDIAAFDEEYQAYLDANGLTPEEFTQDAYSDMVDPGWMDKTFSFLGDSAKTSGEALAITNANMYTAPQNVPNPATDTRISDSSGYGNSEGYGAGYSQKDSRWSNMRLGTLPNGKTATMENAGCGPTALATAANRLGKNVNPAQVGSMAKSNGYISQGGANAGLFTSGASNLGLSGRRESSMSGIINSLSNNKPVILSGRTEGYGSPYTSAGHLVTATGLTRDGRVIVENPEKGRQIMSVNDIRGGLRKAWSISEGYGNVARKEVDKAIRDSSSSSNTTRSTNEEQKLFGENTVIKNGAVFFSQNNDAATGWASKDEIMGHNTGADIHNYGCVMTNAASAVSSVTGNRLDPSMLNSSIWTPTVDGIGQATSTSWQRLRDNYGVNIDEFWVNADNKSAVQTQIENALRNKKPVAVQGKIPAGISAGSIPYKTWPGSAGAHNLLLTGITSDGKITYNDPAKSPTMANDPRHISEFMGTLSTARIFSKGGKGSLVADNNNFTEIDQSASSGSYSSDSTGNITSANGESSGGILDIFDKIGSALSNVSSDFMTSMLTGASYTDAKNAREAEEAEAMAAGNSENINTEGYGRGSSGKRSKTNYSEGYGSDNTGIENRLDKIINIMIDMKDSDSPEGFGSGGSSSGGKTAGDYSQSSVAKKNKNTYDSNVALSGLSGKMTNDLGRSRLRNIHSKVGKF